MNPTTHAILGYSVGLGVLLAYALSLWLAGRSLARREQRRQRREKP
jgi:hypothetical protein